MTSTQQDVPCREARGETEFDAIVVGAGFAGLYMLHKLRELGMKATAIERADGVGGTWHWNRYPGCRCDIESLAYSYSFSEELQREWTWTHRYAAQPEILSYLNHVADRFDLRKDIQLSTSVTAAHYDDASATWAVQTDSGERLRSRFFVMATGCLSDRQVPNFAGLESFRGDWYHTGAWPHEGVDFTGKRVAVIGTGSSGIQSIPLIAKQAERLYVLQRTPQFAIPAWNGPMDPEVMRHTRENYADYRQKILDSFVAVPFETQDHGAHEADPQTRQAVFEAAWKDGGYLMLLAYPDLIFDERSNAHVSAFVKQKIQARINDASLAEKLTPSYPFGAKRLCVDTDYFETYNRDNVTLVSLRETPLQEIIPGGIRTSGGDLDVDVIVFATGFDAMTGALLAVDIRGRNGIALRDAWAAGPKSYLGIAVSGFPNMFTITGPGSPSVLSNMVPAIEQHVDWLGALLTYMRDNGFETVEAEREPELDWAARVDEIASATLYPRADSWYMGRNVPGKVEGFMPFAGGTIMYREIVEDIAARGYSGFALDSRTPARTVEHATV